jgi:hypothetical protein
MESESSTGRQTPYELVFGLDELAEREFPAIAEESQRRRLAVDRPDLFAGMERVGALLQQLVPDATEPRALDRYLEILFHGFNFWAADRPFYAFQAPAVRSLIDGPPDLGAWRLRAPASALYAELPKNLFWSAVTEGEPPEPIEGIFAVLSEPGRTESQAHLLLVLGMRPDRPGFSVASVTTSLEAAADPGEAGAFVSEIPGADLAELYSLRQPSEAVLLLSRLLWYIDVYPESIERVSGVLTPKDSLRNLPTGLDHCRVQLVERDRG